MDQNPWRANPPQHLAGAIIHNIKRQTRRRAAFIMSFYSAIALGAVGAFIPAYSYMSSEIARTGFYEFLVLTYSDSALVMSNWQEMIFALLESLPIVSITAVLTVILTLLASLRMMARTSRNTMRVKTL